MFNQRAGRGALRAHRRNPQRAAHRSRDSHGPQSARRANRTSRAAPEMVSTYTPGQAVYHSHSLTPTLTPSRHSQSGTAGDIVIYRPRASIRRQEDSYSLHLTHSHALLAPAGRDRRRHSEHVGRRCRRAHCLVYVRGEVRDSYRSR